MKSSIYFLILFLVLFLGCKQETKVQKEKSPAKPSLGSAAAPVSKPLASEPSGEEVGSSEMKGDEEMVDPALMENQPPSIHASGTDSDASHISGQSTAPLEHISGQSGQGHISGG